ncbi:Glyoxylase, beta-lactamase superfamily II [bacterium A37T11]|nr:Glyoxylase, beta-lactamase superfamily II [bacterium A37T11]
MHIKSFVFNPYQENTYLIYDHDKSAVIIDPGMYTVREENELQEFITENRLHPELLLNTHCHIDHVLGNKFIYDQYGLLPAFHEGELPLLLEVQNYAPQMGIRYEMSPIPETFLQEEGFIKWGKANTLHLIFAPGHSPGHLCFYDQEHQFLIGGDVLFKNSIGRTDLPGGNHEQLLQNIREKVYTLPVDTIVYPGHGPETTIGDEKLNNPYIRA